MREEHSNAFVPVYPNNNNDITQVKVWEIHYPPEIEVSDKYLKTGFPEIDDNLQTR